MPPLRPLILEPFPDRTPARNLLLEYETNFDEDEHSLSALACDVVWLEECVNGRNRRRIRALKRVLQGHVEDMKQNRMLSVIVFANLSQMLEEEENGVRVDNVEFEELYNSADHLLHSFYSQHERVVELIDIAGGYDFAEEEED